MAIIYVANLCAKECNLYSIGICANLEEKIAALCKRHKAQSANVICVYTPPAAGTPAAAAAPTAPALVATLKTYLDAHLSWDDGCYVAAKGVTVASIKSACVEIFKAARYKKAT